MLGSIDDGDGSLQVLEGNPARTAGTWRGALARFFQVAHEALRRTDAEIRWGRLYRPAFLTGSAMDLRLHAELIAEIATGYPIDLVSPFEDTPSIAGGLWPGREIFGNDCPEALAKLRFNAGTLDLPMHLHEFSDRFIVVAAGSGSFHWCSQSLRAFDGRGIRSMPVAVGELLIFTRGLLHTFSAPDQPLLLLSYHSPEIAFDDPRQYTLPEFRWTPKHLLH
jgi:hypothetical protein